MWNFFRASPRKRVINRRARRAAGPARLSLERLEPRDVPATFDLTVAGASAAVGGALFEQTNVQPTGSGVFNSFLRIQNQGVEQGINTSARPVQFDEKNDPHTRDLLLSEVPLITLDGTAYRQFVLDINQVASRPALSLDELRIFVSNTAGLSGYDAATGKFAGLNPIYNLDAGGDNTVMLRYGGGGSGVGDMFLYVPNALFGGATNVYLYAKLGGQAAANDGFEDWGVLTNTVTPAVRIDKVTVSGARRGDGIEVSSGAALTWVYTVTNVGTAALENVVATDDNGTRDNRRDDFRATFVSGDANNNGRLDVGETWTFTATGTARFNTYANVGTVNAKMVGDNRTVTDSDVSSYFVRPPTPTNPAIGIVKVTVTAAGTGDNVEAQSGENVTWVYTVTNRGDVALDRVRVVDDNGTPGNPADDFTATFVSGDANNNGRLDVGETWTFRATGTARFSNYANVGTAVGSVVGSARTVTARDASSYFVRPPAVGGSAAIDLQKVTASAAGKGDGVEARSGERLTWVYTVTNTGNVALDRVVVVDDNGTPGNPADDFRANFASGDANRNGRLDVGETWTFTATGTARFSNYTNIATVTAARVGTNETVTDRDASSYFIRPPAPPPPAIAIDKRTVFGRTIGDAILVPTNASISWTYAVTNTGTVALRDVRVIDDNGTPDDPSDDFRARYVSGDRDRDRLLDVGETWTFRARGRARANDYTNIATVVAAAVDSDDVVTARDASAYFTRRAVGAGHGGAPPSKRFLLTSNF